MATSTICYFDTAACIVLRILPISWEGRRLYYCCALMQQSENNFAITLLIIVTALNNH
jgi:hypothetical protein